VAIGYVAFAWLLIQVVETLFPVYDFSNAHIRIVVALLVIGFPIVLVISWVYQLTPEGLKRDSDVDQSVSVAHRTGRKLDRAIIVALTLAVGYFAVDKFVLNASKDAGSYFAIPIAVLAFDNLSKDPDNEYFSDGVSRALINILSGHREFRVTSSSSSFTFKERDTPVTEIAKKLGVSFIVDGFVLRHGDRLRVGAQLIDAESGISLWTDEFDPSNEDLFDIQDEIAAAILDALRSALDLDIGSYRQSDETPVPAANDAVMLGQHFKAQRTGPALQRAVEEFRKAIALDPIYALAHAELAITYRLLVGGPFGGGYGTMEFEHGIASAMPHVLKALELGPQLAISHAAKGYLIWGTENTDPLQSFKRALELNPSDSDVRNWIQTILGRHGEFAEAFSMLEAAVQLDPLSIPLNLNYIEALAFRGRVEEAEARVAHLESFCDWCASAFAYLTLKDGSDWAQLILGTLQFRAINEKQAQPRDVLQYHLASVGLLDEALKIADGKDSQVLAVTERDSVREWLRDNNIGPESPGWDGWDGAYTFPWVGMYDEARPALEDIWRNGGPPANYFISVRWPETFILESLVAVRRAEGDEDGAREIVSYMLENVRRHREAGIVTTSWEDSVDYQEGVALYLSGERNRSIELIAQAANDGYWLPPPAVFQDSYYQEPEIIEALRTQSVWAIQERKKLLEVVCNDNPYAVVWEPMPETCAKFFAGSLD
jgi:TolB-like protein